MIPSGAPASVDQTLLVLRIIIGALTAGLLLFTVLVVFLVGSGTMLTSPAGADAFLIALAALAAGVAVAYPIVRRMQIGALARRLRGDSSEEALPGLLESYRTLTISGAAMVEGPGLFAGTIYLLTGQRAVLVAAAAAVALLAAQWPTEEKFQRFTERVRGAAPA